MSALKAVALVVFLVRLSELLGHPAVCGKWVLVRQNRDINTCELDNFAFLNDSFLSYNQSYDSHNNSFGGVQTAYVLQSVGDNGTYKDVEYSESLTIQTYKNVMTIEFVNGIACYIKPSPAMSLEEERDLNETCPLQPNGTFSEAPYWDECLKMYNQRSNN